MSDNAFTPPDQGEAPAQLAIKRTANGLDQVLDVGLLKHALNKQFVRLAPFCFIARYRADIDVAKPSALRGQDYVPTFDGREPVFFSHWRERIQRLITSEEGPTAVEYAVMLALIVVACIGAVGSLATATGSSFDRSSQSINQALSG